MKRFPPKRVLVAVDLSGPSLSALDAAKALALQWDAALEIVSVQNPPLVAVWSGPDAMPVSVPPMMPEPRKRIEERMRKAAGDFPAERLKLRTVSGWAPVALIELARPERADLMVMGSHGYAGLDRLLTGSVSEAVIRRARIPVLTVPERKGLSEVVRVLAPWNGRPYATRALRWARDFSHSLCATLDVLHVMESGGSGDQEWAKMDKRLLGILGAGADWTLRARQGDARARIVAEANSGRYELVVLSAHRRSFGADFVFGSTIERLLRHCEVPVLAVPSGRSRPRVVRRAPSRALARAS